MNIETRELQQIILEKKIIKKEKHMDKIQNAIHKHQRQAHVCGEYGKIQKEQRHFTIIDRLIEKANRLGEEIEQLEKREIELAEIEPTPPLIKWNFTRRDEGPPSANNKPQLDWDQDWKNYLPEENTPPEDTAPDTDDDDSEIPF